MIFTRSKSFANNEALFSWILKFWLNLLVDMIVSLPTSQIQK